MKMKWTIAVTVILLIGLLGMIWTLPRHYIGKLFLPMKHFS